MRSLRYRRNVHRDTVNNASGEALLALRRVRAQSRRTIICACIRKSRVRELTVSAGVHVCTRFPLHHTLSRVVSAPIFSFDPTFRARRMFHALREKKGKKKETPRGKREIERKEEKSLCVRSAC